jgi:branched-chain amino acid aminotransferase
MTQQVYIDGKWMDGAEASLSVFDHGVLYGDGVFEGIRAYEGHVFKLKEHLDRLEASADLISLKIPMPKDQLGNIVQQGLEKNGLKDAYIRLLLTRGRGDLGLDPRKCPKPSVVVIVDKLALFPEQCYQDGLSAVVAKTTRNISEALNPIIKSMNYLNNILAKIEANRKNVPEAIMLNSGGYVAECTGDNVFFVKGNLVVTPPVAAGILNGITRQTVMNLVKTKTSYRMKESFFRHSTLLSADEVFFTGTAAEVIPVTKIDNRVIGKGAPGPVTNALIHLFRAHIQEEIQKSRLKQEQL